VHLEIEEYKTNLEKLVFERTSELAETNLTLESVLDNSNPICFTNTDYELVLANKAYYAIWPKVEADKGTVKCFESRPRSSCKTDSCPLRQILHGKKEIVSEIEKEKNGEKLEFIATARPYRNTKGELLGIVENFQDITSHKRIEDTLASERERLAVTLRSIGDGVITTDTSNKIVLINKVAEELTGWDHKEAIGKQFTDVFNIINKNTNAPSKNPISEVIRIGQIIDLEMDTILIARDGTTRAIADSAAPIRDKESIIIGAVIVFRDITEQLQVEKELTKISKLESIGVLAGGIAHDFNNILAAILGNINILRLDKNLTGESQDLLCQAEKATVRAKELTQQLLTFAKGGEPIKEVTTLEKVIEDSADFVLRGDKVSSRYQIPADLWLVDIDKGQISQVIQNIVLNASHAMPDGGIVTITCENVTSDDESIPLSEGGKFVKITIHDSGTGIPEKLIDKIFDPYFSTKQTNSGLGLAISHSIISKHGGAITVESKEGKGTTFSIYLPASEKKSTGKQFSSEGRVSPPPAKILVMDDDEMVLSVYKKMLVQMGHKIVIARNGEEVVQLYRETYNSEEPFDLIIMDLTIPGGMGGKKTIQEIQKINSKVKSIVSSGYSNDPVMANFKEYGFKGAIAKPFQLKKLELVISKVLLEG
jgi:PAS domain S-box-containing protein